jgi:hypothetical protein
MVQQSVSPKFNRIAIEPLPTRTCRSNLNVVASTFRRNTTEPLMRFVPLQHHQHASPFRGGRTRRTSLHETSEPTASLPGSQPFRLQGFYPRDGFLLASLCRFISSGGHSWGFSLQSLSLRRSRIAFRRSLPSCRLSLPLPVRAPRLQGFYLRRNPLAAILCFHRICSLDALLGFAPFRVFTRIALVPPSRSILSLFRVSTR